MSYNAWPGYADVVDVEFVKEQAPNSWEKLMKILEGADEDIDAFALYIDKDETMPFDDTEIKLLDNIWNELRKEFNNNTDMTLSIGYLSLEGTSRGNQLEDGTYFFVEDYYNLKPKAKQFANKIERKMWVNFG